MSVDLEQLIDTSSLEDLVVYEETDDPDTKAHIINPSMNLHIWQPGMSSQDIVNIARLRGVFVNALCGYRFIPRHDPDKHAACDPCLKAASDMIRKDEG